MPNILIADDEEMIRELVQVTLSRDPLLEIRTATNGREALEAARLLRPDLLILDVRMPGMNGLEVCRTLRDENGAGFILMLTAMGQASDVQAGKTAGADDYFIKPFSPADLLKRVYEVLESAA